MAIFIVLNCFTRDLVGCNILVKVDDTTALSYINHMGNVQHLELCLLTKNIWEWCESRNLWLFASYVESKKNKADWDSRVLSVDTELSDTAFSVITQHLGQPDLDLFALVANSKCKNFMLSSHLP